ncbi:MAG: hypothetical protein PPP58_09985 [Natronomonas sp.]
MSTTDSDISDAGIVALQLLFIVLSGAVVVVLFDAFGVTAGTVAPAVVVAVAAVIWALRMAF